MKENVFESGLLSESEKMEARLTPENRALVERYIHNCNEEWSAFMLMRPFNEYTGEPISNAFFLHELEEIALFKAKGQDFVNVEPTAEFKKLRNDAYDSDTEPHLSAVLLHCKYLQAKAADAQVDLSLGTVIEYDPLSSRRDKEAIFAKDPSLEIKESEKARALEFFTALAIKEFKIFDQPFSLGNTRMYMDAVMKRSK